MFGPTYIRPYESPTPTVGGCQPGEQMSRAGGQIRLAGSAVSLARPGLQPDVPELPGRLLRGGLIDVDPPHPVESVRPGADFQVPVVVLGDGRPFTGEDLGCQVRRAVERHLE